MMKDHYRSSDGLQDIEGHTYMESTEKDVKAHKATAWGARNNSPGQIGLSCKNPGKK